MIKEFEEKYGNYLKIALGIICIVFQEHIYREFTLIFGLYLLEQGIQRSHNAWKSGEAFDGHSPEFARGFLFICVAIGILIIRYEALYIAGMFWGITGFIKCEKFLNILLVQYKNHQRISIRYAVSFIIEFILSMILIFDTLDSIPHHIIILGIELIVEGILEPWLEKAEAKRNETSNEINKQPSDC